MSGLAFLRLLVIVSLVSGAVLVVATIFGLGESEPDDDERMRIWDD